MSLPIKAVGPLKVETKPILMESAASAGCASARTVAAASQNAVFIFTPLFIYQMDPVSPVTATASRASLWGDVFCARNRKSAASTNRGPPLEPSAHTPAPCTIIRRRREWQEL